MTIGISLVSAIVGAALGAWWTGREPKTLAKPHSPPPVEYPDHAGRVTQLEVQVTQRDETIASLRARVSTLEMASSATAIPVVPEMPMPIDGDALRDAAQNILQNESFQNILERGWRDGVQRIIDHQYGDLFERLDLDDEAADKLRDLLVNKVAQDSQPWIPWLRDNPESPTSPEMVEEQMRRLLDEESYQTYRHFELTQAARESVRWYQHQMADSDDPLSGEQREELVNLFHTQIGEEDVQTAWVTALQGNSPGDDVDLSLDEMESAYQNILNQSESFLSDAQTSRLESYLNQQLRQREMQVEMARKLAPALRGAE
jgi:hypothetical protein